MYGFAQSALVFYISFFCFTYSANEDGGYGDLWLIGTFAYGTIVILANMVILHNSNSHTIYSMFFIFASVGAYFVLFWLFSFLGLSTLDHEFSEMISFHYYPFCLAFFFLMVFPVDTFFNFLTQKSRERSDYNEK